MQLNVAIPSNASGSYWAAVVLAAIPRTVMAKGSALAAVPQVAVGVIVTVAGTEQPAIKISDVTVERQKAGSASATCAAENRGNTAVMLTGAFAIEKRANGVVEELSSTDIQPILSLPGTRTRLRTKLGHIDVPSALHVVIRFGTRPGDFAEADASVTEAGGSPTATTQNVTAAAPPS